MEPGTVVSIGIGGLLVTMTAVILYTAFGPPAKELADPFDDHED